MIWHRSSVGDFAHNATPPHVLFISSKRLLHAPTFLAWEAFLFIDSNYIAWQ